MVKLDYNEDDIQTVMEMTGNNAKESEKLILQVYKDMEDDTLNIFDILDVIESECKVKANNIKNVVVSVDKKVKKDSTEKKPRTVKTSDEKKTLFNEIFTFLSQKYDENVTIMNENKLIGVKINGKSFKIDLIETKKK